jgi:glutaredoxin
MSSEKASSPPRSSRERKIIVYTTASCHKCAALKDWLKAFNGNFSARALNVDFMAELIMKNFIVLSAPVLEIGDAVYVEAEFFDGNTLAVDKLREIFGEQTNE